MSALDPPAGTLPAELEEAVAALELPPNRYLVALELNGTPGDYTYLIVHADQRDMRRARLQTQLADGDDLGQLVAMTWAAARRRGLTELSWTQWELVCAWTVPDTGAEPLRPTATAGDS